MKLYTEKSNLEHTSHSFVANVTECFNAQTVRCFEDLANIHKISLKVINNIIQPPTVLINSLRGTVYLNKMLANSLRLAQEWDRFCDE